MDLTALLAHLDADLFGEAAIQAERQPQHAVDGIAGNPRRRVLARPS